LLPWDSKNIKNGVPRAKTVSKHTREGVNANAGTDIPKFENEGLSKTGLDKTDIFHTTIHSCIFNKIKM
jgi:hypothetical protein